jgi:hypothetical protein
MREHNILIIWHCRRSWWGIAWLPEFWLTVVFGIALGWSLLRDFRELKRPAEPGAI